MRVLFLTDSLSDLDGVGRYTIRLITALEELEPGLEVEVLLARKHRPNSAQIPAHWKVRVVLPPDYFFYMTPSRFWPSLVLGVARAWPAARRADLVHAIKDYPHNLLALWVARLAGRECVATAHGTYSVQPLLDPRHASRARKTYRRLASVISVSRYTARRLKEELRDGELDGERLQIIPNAVDASHYRARRDVGAKPWHGLRYTLAMGELKERKGHHVSIEAFARVAKRHTDLHHFLVGKHSDADYKRELDALVAREGVADRVHFLGNIGEDEKIDLLQRSAVFVHTPVTSKDGGFEGFGIVYLEAAACGVPSIGTRESGAEDAVVDGETGFLAEPNVASVAAALERLIAEPETARRMGAAGLRHAEQSSWRDNAERVLAIYRKILS
ncbi:MAG: glycosyltransferase family 4 protein [Planctomycetes bacterium]|nr:glycosyltransferase family 4 protein [Planctomycetota bacterium]